MSLPEFRSPEIPNNDFDFTSLIFDGIKSLERQERKSAFADLRTQIERVEILGTDDARRQSFHRTFVEDGTTRLVLFDATNFEGVGRTYRVIVNDISILADDSRQILITDFMVAAHANIITRNASWFEHDHHVHTYRDLPADVGPLLSSNSNQAWIIKGSDYSLSLPDPDPPKQYSEVLNRREYAEELSLILMGLNSVSLEDDIVLAE